MNQANINLKDYFKLNNEQKPLPLEQSYNFFPFGLDTQNLTPKKYKEPPKNRSTSKKGKSSKHFIDNEQMKNYKNINIQIDEINNKLNNNLGSIKILKDSLNDLKNEKNKKKNEIVNLLSNRESVDEIYINYIDYLKCKNFFLKKNKKIKSRKQVKNPFENQDEDSFEILIEEIKISDKNKFIEQSFNLIEEIFENPNKQLKLEFKSIINKSYDIFYSEINKNKFIDTYSVVSNFFLRMSIFLSNKSNGKYSETMVNLFMRCLLKMNAINVKNEELICYMNGKYKNEKNKLKEEIRILINNNEMMNKKKNDLEIKLREIEERLNIKSEKKEHNNMNNLNILLVSNEDNNNNNLNNKKYQLDNKLKKIYKEDIVSNENIENKMINHYKYKKIVDTPINFNYTDFKKNNEDINKKINSKNFEIERSSFKLDNNTKNQESDNISKYKIKNYNDNYSISTQNFAFTSPKIDKKKQFYYKNNLKQSDNSMNASDNKNLSKLLSNKKKKVQKKLNFQCNTNKIITYNDIKKNMKFDLAKKIKYLDKVNKNNNIKNNKALIDNKKPKVKMLLTEKNDKEVKYNFFDIIQETNNKLRNSSGDTTYKQKINSVNRRNIFNINLNKANEALIKSDHISNRKISFFFNKEKEKENNKNNYMALSTVNAKYNKIKITKNKKNGSEKNNNDNGINGGDYSFNKKILKPRKNTKKITLDKNSLHNNTINQKIKVNGKNNYSKKEITKFYNNRNILLKNENFNNSKEVDKIIRNRKRESLSDNKKNKIKINKMLLLKRSLSSALNKLINNNLKTYSKEEYFDELNTANNSFNLFKKLISNQSYY